MKRNMKDKVVDQRLLYSSSSSMASSVQLRAVLSFDSLGYSMELIIELDTVLVIIGFLTPAGQTLQENE